MTMENNDGRPLDDEAGGEDPQGWYFDLPGGAWERQEEKNRTLRQRVLGNISEDAEKAKSDPFARQTPEPEEPAKGGLFGFGRKKKQPEPPRESAGGTWTLSGSQMPGENPNGDEPEEADDWSTEIPLHVEPPKDLTLRRRTAAEHGEPWAAADAGWSIGAEDGDADTASTRDDAQDFRDRMQFWARGGQAEPGSEVHETADELEDGPAKEGVPAAADLPFAAAAEALHSDASAVDDAATVDEPGTADEDFISGMRSWANASPGGEAEEDEEDLPAPARNDVLQLRPRHAEPDEKRLDRGSPAAGWSQPADRNDPGASGDEPARFSGEPEPDEPADMLESMRRWAENAKESEHPHFALQHQGDDEVVGGEPPVIPLRPRNQEDHLDEHAPAHETSETAEPDQPRTIPIVLRSRTEPQPETVNRDADEAPTRWDEFFGLDQPDQGGDSSGTGEGLAAMRDWAMKRPEAETEHEIPEEFLKPFDWELGDADSTDTAGRVTADAAELSEWEAEDETALTAFAVVSAADAQDEPVDVVGGWIVGAAASDDQPEPVAPAALASGETGEVDEDPLAGLFDRPAVPTAPEKKPGGMFGRLFGRKKHEPDPEPAPASVDHEPGDWVLPEEDSDVRTVAAESSPEWVATEVEDQPGASSPYGTFAEGLDAGDREVVAAVASEEDDGFDDEWVEIDEPSPAAMLQEIVTAFERPVVSEAPEAPVAESSWAPEEASEAATHGEQAAEPAIFALGDESQEESDEFAWEPEPVTYEEPMASAAEPGDAEVEPEDATPLIAAIQLSLDALGGSDGAAEPVDPVAEEPVADEKPWWEQPAVEEEPVEAVASIEPVAEEPVAEDKPRWEQPAAEEEPPVEAVASVEHAAEEPVADEKPWWEQPAAEEAPVEAGASIEPVAVEPVAEDKPWWEQPAAEEAPVEAGASIEPVAVEPVAEDKPWWEQPAVEEEAPVEAVASIEPVAEEPVVDGDDDDPWAEFVGGEPEAGPLPSAAASLAGSWTTPAPAWTPPAPPSTEHDEDMWGDIAAQAEEAAFGANDGPGIDLAASLESQMAERPIDAPRDWESAGIPPARPDYGDERGAFEPEEADEDVILRAFERHAATPDPEAQPDPAVARETEEALAALFGQDAAQIVDESGAEAEPQSFMRLSGFAPQRESFDGNWAPEADVQEVLAHDRAPYGGTDGAGFLPPPWAAEEFGAEGEGATIRPGSKTKTWIRELVETGLLALLVFLSVRASFQNFKVDGSSMYPTLEDGQFLIVNKLVYSEVDVEKLGKFIPFIEAGEDPKRNVFHGPQRGDIVVLQDPRKPETDLIKRVIGLPGETVEIVGGKVYINDLQLDEPYITSPWNDTKPKILIPDSEYYVLGDNRDNSLDSRSSQVGLVPKDLIIGKAMLSYWPRDKFGLAPNEGGALGDQKPVLTTKRIGED
ncbi:MAG: signal peptidase I [Dehalococcoidia bacterium]|nr:signal peptidase I [Dehalococcoidia bacterium]